MKDGVISKQEISKFLNHLKKDARVFAPVMTDGEAAFKEFDDSDTIEFSYSNLKLSPKGIFFPQTEELLSFDYDDVADVPVYEDRIVVFGSRPCDARSLTYLDKIFSEENKGYNDPYYMNRRKNAVMISLVCSSPCRTCFCSSLDGGPADEQGSDILAFDLGEQIYLKSVTATGESTLESAKDLVNPAPENSKAEAEKQASQALESMEDLGIDSAELKKKLDASFNDPDWDKLTRNCIGCGACTYLCPTCYCFDIADEQRMYKGKRIRTWDSCQYASFTKHASGHNPRTNKKERLRQRFMHKFSYTVENQGDVFCVGCGRCISQCPVNIDIREVITTFAKK